MQHDLVLFLLCFYFHICMNMRIYGFIDKAENRLCVKSKWSDKNVKIQRFFFSIFSLLSFLVYFGQPFVILLLSFFTTVWIQFICVYWDYWQWFMVYIVCLGQSNPTFELNQDWLIHIVIVYCLDNNSVILHKKKRTWQ
jgi:hypothetical protein